MTVRGEAGLGGDQHLVAAADGVEQRADHRLGVTVAVDALTEACRYLSRAKFGALIALEREVGLRGMVEGGTQMGAELAAATLQTIFFPGTALHDLGVVVKGNVIQAAGVQFPLAEPADMPDARLGSRHRAAVGLSKESDAIVIVVSEETGQIRLADGGRLTQALTTEELQTELLRRLRSAPPPPPDEHALQPRPEKPPHPPRGAGAPA